MSKVHQRFALLLTAVAATCFSLAAAPSTPTPAAACLHQELCATTPAPASSLAATLHRALTGAVALQPTPLFQQDSRHHNLTGPDEAAVVWGSDFYDWLLRAKAVVWGS